MRRWRGGEGQLRSGMRGCVVCLQAGGARTLLLVLRRQVLRILLPEQCLLGSPPELAGHDPLRATQARKGHARPPLPRG